MNEMRHDKLEGYYRDAESWAEDRNAGLERSSRTAWWVAGGAAIIALLEAIALVLLVPLKTVEPYTLLVDRQTGYVQALKPLSRETIAPDAALVRSFLVQYVIAREGFAFDLATRATGRPAASTATSATAASVPPSCAGWDATRRGRMASSSWTRCATRSRGSTRTPSSSCSLTARGTARGGCCWRSGSRTCGPTFPAWSTSMARTPTSAPIATGATAPRGKSS